MTSTATAPSTVASLRDVVAARSLFGRAGMNDCATRPIRVDALAAALMEVAPRTGQGEQDST